MRPTAILILLIVIASMLVSPVSGAQVTITIEKERVKAQMTLSLHQNMTDFPNQTSAVSIGQDQKLSAAFTEALKKADPAAAPSELALKVDSSNTWLNLTVTLRVSGISETRGDVSAVSTTWRAYNISADLRVGNLSYNTVGKRYLRPVIDFYTNASKFENNPNATIKAVTFFVNVTQSVSGQDAANRVGNLTVLDFRPLSVPLEQWTRTYNLSNNTTTWRYAPAALLAASVRATRLNRNILLFSDYSYSAEIIVPGLARAIGNTLLVDVGTGQKEWIMAGIVVFAILLAIVAQVLFRAKRKALKLRRR